MWCCHGFFLLKEWGDLMAMLLLFFSGGILGFAMSWMVYRPMICVGLSASACVRWAWAPLGHMWAWAMTSEGPRTSSLSSGKSWIPRDLSCVSPHLLPRVGWGWGGRARGLLASLGPALSTLQRLPPLSPRPQLYPPHRPSITRLTKTPDISEVSAARGW